MGCASSKEKLENEIMELNIEKIEIQMEKYNQMQLLGKNKNANQIKELQSNTIINNNSNNTNINNKRKAIKAKTTKGSVEQRTGKGRRSKSVRTARVKSNINNI